MTFREKLKMEHADKIDSSKPVGCIGCPTTYGYEKRSLCPIELIRLNIGASERCKLCWDREIPGTEKKEEDDYYLRNVGNVHS